MLAIFIQSSIGSLELPDFGFDFMDKVFHFFVFGVLGVLTARGLRNVKNRRISDNYLSFTLLICAIYGALDEIHQYFVPGRHFSLGDMIADILGVIVLGLVYKFYVDLRVLKNNRPG
jgi:VanZ family protein